MSATVKIRVLRAFWLDRNTIAEPGTVVEMDALAAFDLSPSKGEIIGDPVRARAAIDEAAKAHNDTLPRAPRGSQSPGEAAAPQWHVLPNSEGYRPSRYN